MTLGVSLTEPVGEHVYGDDTANASVGDGAWIGARPFQDGR